MIKSISIKNFKCFREGISVELGNLSVFSGMNSSGKSSLYQPLLCLAQSSRRNTHVTLNNSTIPILSTYGDLIKLGSPSELIPNKSKKLVLATEFENSYLDFYYKLNDRGELLLTDQKWQHYASQSSYEYHFNSSNNSFIIKGNDCFQFKSFSLRQSLENIVSEQLRKHGKEKILKHDEEIDDIFIYKKKITIKKVLCVHFFRHYLDYISLPWEEIESLIKPQILKYLNLSDILTELRKNSSKTSFDLFVSSPVFDTLPSIEMLIHINPFRGTPKRYYDYVQDKDIIESYKYQTVKGNRIPYKLSKSGKIEKATVNIAIQYWVKKILGIDNIKVIDRIHGVSTEIMIVNGNKKYPINTVGYGLGQSIPIIIQLLTRPDSFLYVIDEPEIHLHPQAQIAFSEFILTMAKIGKQIILETHSEYMISKFILNSIQTNEKVSLFWVVNKNHNSEIVTIEYDELGFIKNKPNGFSDGLDSLVQETLNYRMSKL